ncbi:MAG TPA: transporter [Vicinamibacterales bacterium]
MQSRPLRLRARDFSRLLAASPLRIVGAVALLLLPWSATTVHAQDLFPGAFTPAPVGFNVVTATASFSHGDLAFDPSVPIEEGRATMGGYGVGFNRTLSIGGRFSSVGLGLPFASGHLQGVVRGQLQEVTRAGQGDVSGRVAVNLYGAPAMTAKEFASYRQATILGVSLVVRAPIGQYVESRFINIGTNRWAFTPEFGFSRRRGRWTLEGNVGTTFFTDNPNYVGASRQQAPIVGLQGHLIYTFRPGMWLAGDGNFWRGGRTTTDGVVATVEQKNSRLGITFARPIRRQQWRIAYSFGAYTTVGGDFHSVGMSYSYAWAARP